MNCPHCGTHIEPTRKKKPITVSAPVDTTALSDKALYAYYKRTSHIEDVRFFADRTVAQIGRNRIHEDTLSLLRAAEQGLPRAETLRQLTALHDAWRRTSDVWSWFKVAA